ncbi:MAG: Rrf2 family transcriptional regulator [Magnetococcales bacterium]|nr:Rrf2 family transcriptional regulator [Magnetococcales bacterium]
MFSINRMTEYATLVMARCAADPVTPMNATDLAAEIPLAPTTLRKLLQTLARQGLLISQRGRNGGFVLARPPSEITLAQVMEALDGPMRLTPCSHADMECHLQGVCKPRPHWLRISKEFLALLEATTLAQMVASSNTREPSP